MYRSELGKAAEHAMYTEQNHAERTKWGIQNERPNKQTKRRNRSKHGKANSAKRKTGLHRQWSKKTISENSRQGMCYRLVFTVLCYVPVLLSGLACAAPSTHAVSSHTFRTDPKWRFEETGRAEKKKRGWRKQRKKENGPPTTVADKRSQRIDARARINNWFSLFCFVYRCSRARKNDWASPAPSNHTVRS